jgi:hypothetical protein
MIYKCECCSFSTSTRRSYNYHINTDKHKQKSNASPIYPENGYMDITDEKSIYESKNNQNNENKRYDCTKCGNSYAYYSGLAKHSKKCNNVCENDSPEVIKLKYELKYKDLQLEFEKKEKELEKREKEFLLKQVKKNDKLIDIGSKNMNDLIQTNMKALDFLNTYYKDTPCLENFEEKFTDPYTFYLDVDMEYDGEYFITSEQKIDKNIFIITKIANMENMEQTVKYYVTKMIEYYKDTDFPQLQKMWANDTSRTNYTIKTKFSDKITGWQSDKSGNIIIDKILKPLLLFTRNLIIDKCEDNEDFIKQIAKDVGCSNMKTLSLLAEYKYKVNNNIFQPEIMKQLTSVAVFFIFIDI